MEINTKDIAEAWKTELKQRVSELDSQPELLIIMAQDYSPASEIYVKNKLKVAKELGIKVVKVEISWIDKSKEELINNIQKQIKDHRGYSVIVQLPFPQVTESEIARLIPPEFDVDGFTNTQKGLLASGNEEALVPCTALGVMKILEASKEDLTSKSITIVNRSNLIGKPLLQLALKKNMTPTIIHSKSNGFDKINSFENSDIIVTGCGERKIFNSYDIRKETVKTIIDCSMKKVEGVPGVGDFDKEEILERCPSIKIASGYGHTGLMTVVALFNNVIQAHIQNNLL